VSRVCGALPVLAVTVLISAVSASAADATLTVQPQLGVPGLKTLFGASPGEAPGEVWATGETTSVPAIVGGQPVLGQFLLRRAQGTGWQIVPVADGQGPLSFTGTPQATYGGGVAMLSRDFSTIITHDPSGASGKAPAPPPAPATGAVLEAGERLSESFAAIDEGSQRTGALIVPAGLSAAAPGVLHYDGAHDASAWTREPICESAPASPEPCAPPADLGSVKAVAASSPQEAWLLASTGRSAEPMLFKRTEVGGPGSGSFAWVPVQVTWVPASQGQVSTLTGARPMLTVTRGGVWVDADLENDGQHADLSLLVKPLQIEKSGQWSSQALGRWCYPHVSPACSGSLGAPLPERYSSFAWSGTGSGTRIIAGLSAGALLQFQGGGDFQYVFGGGGLGTPNAAFSKSGEAPPEGWIAGASGGDGQATVERVGAAPEPPLLGAEDGWPLPFRRPLLAIAPQPDAPAGEAGAQALAVGDGGQVARYQPGQGWTPEFLYNGAGKVQTPLLRGVAWPEPGRAYAVGDEGAMWLWRADTGLWEPDPGTPLGLHANLTAIAFSPLDPAVGYAVGKQGALLRYDKTWTQQELPASLAQADFTSVTFAGAEALATYRMVPSEPQKVCPQQRIFCEVGGLIVNRGSGWEIDPSAQGLLQSLPSPAATVLSKVAGLPRGGAVAAGPGLVIERDSAGSPWRFSRQPLPEAQNISALAAIEAGAEVRALVSIDISVGSNPNIGGLFEEIDPLSPPGFGQPFGLVGPDPPPYTGYLLRETGEGWQDLGQQAYPRELQSFTRSDLPNWPDPVLALNVNATGSQGWAVGGQTGKSALLSDRSQQTSVETSAALRLGPGASPPQRSGAAISKPEGQATFAVGGDAQCQEPCAALLAAGLGPKAWLSGALSTAARIPRLRAFLYTGGRVAGAHGGLGSTWNLNSDQFGREMRAYADDLSQGGGLPVRVAPTPSDIDPEGGLSTFANALGAAAGQGSSQLPGTGAYAFDSGGSGGTVRVIVLDDTPSAFALGELSWLEAQLVGARGASVPAIVMGATNIAESGAPSPAALEQVLLNPKHGASAYFYDSPNENSATRIGSGSNAIPAFGTGTLGYVPPASQPEDFLGASGFLLASVNVAQRNASTNRAPVTATLTPNIAQLALNATDGTLLRRSQVALFQAVARRSFGGSARVGQQLGPDPYVPIPETCIGSNCGQFIEPEYTFTSSRPDVGTFVAPQRSSTEPRAVLQGADGRPIPESHSGLFCAFNAGTTTVSIATGGLTYSEQVTVQAGSVEQPCGTVPLKNPPAVASSASAPVAALPPSAPPASSPTPLALAPPPAPAPVAAPPLPAPVRPSGALPPFLARPLPVFPLLALPLLPPPPLARPIPPSGTSPVTAPVAAPEEQQEDEEAVESARNSMAVYNPEDPMVAPLSTIALIVIAAAAGAGIRRAGRRRRMRGAPALARARTQRYDWL
jgi:hypothetical protein